MSRVRTIAAFAGLLAVAVVSPQIATAAPPSASFIFEPSTPAVNETITFSSTSTDPDGEPAPGAHAWDLDNDGQFDDAVGRTVTHSFATPGTRTVRLQVTDTDGVTTSVASRDVTVQANPPTADFGFSPATPLTGQTVTFDSSASAPPAGETITAQTWDLDGDGEFDDASGAVVTFSYATPGPRTVSLRVESSGGGFDIVSKVVRVANRAPIADFDIAPRAPRVGTTIALASASTDPDGPIAEQTWDLDGDGQFDDARGPTAEVAFAQQGVVNIGLRVRDAEGATDQVRKEIFIARRDFEPMSPSPVVRLTGELRPDGATLIERLTVTAPKRSVVALTCTGADCPFRQQTRVVYFNRVKFPALAKKLDPGVVLRVFVTDPAKLGKFTRFRMRNGKAPERHDACLRGEARDPVPCPRQ